MSTFSYLVTSRRTFSFIEQSSMNNLLESIEEEPSNKIIECLEDAKLLSRSTSLTKMFSYTNTGGEDNILGLDMIIHDEDTEVLLYNNRQIARMILFTVAGKLVFT